MREQRSMTVARALRLLDVEPGASPSEVRQAYLDLVRVWHPDRFEGDARLKEKAGWRLSEINAAFELLQTDAGRQPAATSASHRAEPAARRTARTRPPAAAPSTSRPSARTFGGRLVIAAAAVATLALTSIPSVPHQVAAGATAVATPAAPPVPAERHQAGSADPLPDAAAVEPDATAAAPAASTPRASAGGPPNRPARSPFSRDLDRTLTRTNAQMKSASSRSR